MSRESAVGDIEDDGVHPWPNPDRVLRRALALSAVACRSFMEQESDRNYAADMVIRIRGWIEEVGLVDDLEPAEREMISTPLGELTSKQAVDGSWRSEGLYVLCWALHAQELLPHDQIVAPGDASEAIGFLHPEALAGGGATLRTRIELDGFDRRQLALHWRFRDFSLRSASMDFGAFVRNCAWAELEIDPALLADGDLAIDGKRIDRVDPARVRECLSIAGERHRAINWLRGWDPIYSEVDTST